MARTVFIHAPLAGVQRQLGKQRQEPYSSIDALNFWPVDAVSGRKVSATRPPLTAIASPGAGVNLLQRVNGDASQDPQQSMVAAYDGDIFYWDGAAWQAASMGAIALPTSRALYATTFLKEVFIMVDTDTPVVFDYDDNSVSQAVATEGTFPSDCRIACTWQGGIWVAGSVAQPHVFSGSRTGDPYDWDFAAPDTDTGGAFTATGENFGLIGEAITALIPFTEDVLIIATEQTMWALRGHPRRGGVLENISQTIGVLGQGAWTQDASGRVFFMSRNGVGVLQGGGAPSLVSRQFIPDDLVGLTHEYLDPKICLAYDNRYNAVHVTVRGDQEQAWFYDLDTGGFHPMSFAAYPYVLLNFPPLEAEAVSAVLYGGTGYGGVARFNTNGSESFLYRLIVGPFQISPSPMRKSMIVRAQHIFNGGTTESDSNIIVGTWVGGTADDCYNKYLNDQRVGAHRVTMPKVIFNNGRVFPRLDGHFALIEITNGAASSGTKVIYEGTQIDLEDTGTAKRSIGRVGGSFDPSSDFNPARWSAVAVATPLAPSSISATERTDAMLFIDLSRMPAGWWSAVHSTGRDIRVTRDNNTLLPRDVINFDKDAQTGLLVVKATVEESDPAVVRVYAGNPTVLGPDVTAAAGQYNTYPDYVHLFVPDGGLGDRTRNQLAGTNENGVITSGGAAGPLGAAATSYSNTINGWAQYLFDDPVTFSGRAAVLYYQKITAFDLTGTANQELHGASILSNSGSWSLLNALYRNDTVIGQPSDGFSALANDDMSASTFLYPVADDFATVAEGSIPDPSNFHAVAVEYVDGGFVQVRMRSSAGGTTSAFNANFSSDLDFATDPYIGVQIGLNNSTFGAPDVAHDLSLVMICDTTATGSDFHNYWLRMIDQSAFWGTWSLG